MLRLVFLEYNSETLGLLDAVCRSETSVNPLITKQGHIPDDLSVKTDKIKSKGKDHPITDHEGAEMEYRHSSTLS